MNVCEGMTGFVGLSIGRLCWQRPESEAVKSGGIATKQGWICRGS